MSVGIWQVVLILLIVLIIFGAGKLPKVMGDVAKGIKSFKAGMKDEDETPPPPSTVTTPPDAGATPPASSPRVVTMEPEAKKDEPARN